VPQTTAVTVRSQTVGTETNRPISPRKPAKTRGSYLPEAKVLAIQQRYLKGENKTSIAKAEGCDRETVARIVQFPEVRNFIAQMQQEFYGLVPDAMAALRHALLVTKDPRVAYQVLEATGVAPHRNERLQMPETTSSETGVEGQLEMMAAVMLEGHENFGVDFPDDVAAALAKRFGNSGGGIARRKAAAPLINSTMVSMGYSP
jgi:hypothetical protein